MPTADPEVPVIPLTPAAPVPLTKEELAAGEQAFQAKIDEFLAAEIKLSLNILMLNWNKGNFIIDLEHDPRQYANHKTADAAKRFGCSVSSVSSYVDFARSCSKEKVIEWAEQNLPWNNVIALLAVASPEKREKLEAQVTDPNPDKRLTSDELRKKVREINKKTKTAARKAGVRVSNRGGVSPIVVIRSFTGLAGDLIAKKSDFKTAYVDFRAMEDGHSKEETAAALKEAFQAIKKLSEDLASLEDYRQKQTLKDKAK